MVVETTDQAEHGTEREAKSDKHEAEDLLAQQQAASAAGVSATATDRQVIPAYWQAALATLGAIGLFWTIILTRQSLTTARLANVNARTALALAQEANEHAQVSSERETRAYISVNPADVRMARHGHAWIGHVEIANVGKVPARDVRVLVKAELNLMPMWDQFDQPDATTNIGVIQPGVAIRQGSPQINVGHEDEFVFVFGTVNYDDGFGNPRWTRFCHRYTGKAIEVSDGTAKAFRGIPADTARQHPHGNNAD